MLINVTLPVFNEEAQLADSVAQVVVFLDKLREQATATGAQPSAASASANARHQLASGSDVGAMTVRRAPEARGTVVEQPSHPVEADRPGAFPSDWLARSGPFDYELVIANNGSTDRTLEIARRLAREYNRVLVLDVPQKGRGGALKRAWLDSRAEVLSYLDVDLSTDLAAFPTLVGAVASGQCDLAFGSRLLAQSEVQRGWRRELLSRGYNRLVRLLLHTGITDLQCGFKAIRRAAAQTLLPQVADGGWFFDTELLVLAERLGYRLGEIPVHWIEDRDSRVKVISTALADLRGLWRLRRQLVARSLNR
jgi:hypothetical protein